MNAVLAGGIRLRCHRARALSSVTDDLPRYGLWIDNQLVEASGGSLTLLNPATEEAVGVAGAASAEDVSVAVASAAIAAADWSASGARQRAAVLRRAADGMARLTEVETISTGRPIAEFRAQLGRLPEWFEYHASLCETVEDTMPPFGGDRSHVALVERRPLGVVGLITPWNHPLLIATKKIAVALASGNVAVVKPAEIAPVSVLALAKIFKEAGAPPGVLNVVPGHGAVAGASLAAHEAVRRVDFTGGDAAGRKLGAVVGARAASFCAELGGNAPVLVFEDCDVDEAVNGVAFGAFVAAGQTCVSAKRCFVHRSVYAEFVDKLARKTRGLCLGDPMDPAVQVGPLASKHALEMVEAQVDALLRERAGVTVAAGGRRSTAFARGFYYEPTVLTGPGCIPDDEIFGPFLAVEPFDSEAEAVDRANASRHALGAALWTENVRRAHRVMRALHAGVIWANAHHRNAPDAPWGGYGASGTGRENGLEAYREYTTTTTMILKTAETKEDWFAHPAPTAADGGPSPTSDNNPPAKTKTTQRRYG